MNNKAFYNMSYGVYAVLTWDEGKATGCIANSVMQITSEPPTVAVSMNHNNYTHLCMEKTGKFSVSILGINVDPTIIGTLGYRSGREIDKFESIRYEVKSFLPVISEACSYFTCEIVDKFETETHTIFLGKVTDCDNLKKEEPMTYAYFHETVKGKSPKNAPTYIAD